MLPAAAAAEQAPPTPPTLRPCPLASASALGACRSAGQGAPTFGGPQPRGPVHPDGSDRPTALRSGVRRDNASAPAIAAGRADTLPRVYAASPAKLNSSGNAGAGCQPGPQDVSQGQDVALSASRFPRRTRLQEPTGGLGPQTVLAEQTSRRT